MGNRYEQQGMAIGRRFRGERGADLLAATGAVIHYKLLIQ
jgi:hypothetical protein